MSEVLDIPLSITEQLDHEVLYWDPGISVEPSLIKLKEILGVLATELDAYITREYAVAAYGMSIVRPIRSFSYIEVNEKARLAGCKRVDVIGKMSEGRGGVIVDTWTVPCE